MSSSRYFSLPKPRIFAHRGASVDFPENTLEAFREAARFTPYLELDVWMSRDGVVVIHHDESLDRSCGVPSRVVDLEFSELKELDPGYVLATSSGERPWCGRGITIPSLAEVFEAFPPCFFNIEIKHAHEAAPKAVLDLIDRYKLSEQCLLTSGNDAVMPPLRACLGTRTDIVTGFSTAEAQVFVDWLLKGASGNYRPPGQALQLPLEYKGLSLSSPRLIEAAHALGVEVHYWTINDVAEARRLVSLGADGIVTDNPRLMATLRDETTRLPHHLL